MRSILIKNASRHLSRMPVSYKSVLSSVFMKRMLMQIVPDQASIQYRDFSVLQKTIISTAAMLAVGGLQWIC